ncbi:MAG: hypothetical protein FJ291_30340 [Planctomycetes bacterium]|nr:hypothetical protein [Planctomycetota bacterium]
MNEFVTEFFTATTAEDQDNYFYGVERSEVPARTTEGARLAPGTYRVVDGMLCRILSGLPKEDIYEQLRSAAK